MKTDTSFPAKPRALEEQRQLNVRACDTCRKKKIRCEPTTQGCVQCTKYCTRCHFTPISARKKPRRPANFKYIAQLEERVLKMEALLGAELPRGSTPESSNQGSDFEFSLLAHETELSTIGFHTENHLARDLSLQITPGLGSLSLPAAQQLPTKAVALELVKETFSRYIKFLPLFDEEDFLKEFQFKYTTSNPGDPGWWASINVVLSLAHCLRALATADPADTKARAEGYFQNALAVVSELTVSHRSLSAVQALVGMASILQGTPDPEPSSVLAAAALRLAQNMDLHRECSNVGLTTSQAEQRRRVFWLAYILDKDISLRLEQPFGQDDDDMDVQLPSDTHSEISENGFETCSVSLLNYRIGLAVIQGQVYKMLYSIQAKRQAEPQRATTARNLNSSLSYWKSIALPELPDGSTILPGGHVSGEMIHKVVLRLTYIHCLAMIDGHLPPMMQSSFEQKSSQSEMMLLYPESACLSESRKAMRLLDLIPHGDRSCVWMLLHAFFAAASNVLLNLTWNPTSPEAHSDLRRVRPFLLLLKTLDMSQKASSRSEEFDRINRVCNDLNTKAREAVQLFGISTMATMGV